MPTPNEEIYKFVKDRYDKAFTARQMWQTRLQHLLLFCGFFVTAVVSFLGPTTFGILADCDSFEEFVAASIAISVFLALVLYLAFPIHRLLSVIAKVDLYVTEMDKEEFLEQMRKKGNADIDAAYSSLGCGYLDATEGNTQFGAYVGNTIRKTVFHLRILAGLTLIVILIVGSIRVTVKSDWISLLNKEQPSMSDQGQKDPAPSKTPETTAPTTPETTPIKQPDPQPIRVKTTIITGQEDRPPTSIQGSDPSKRLN